jgi:hypothetical protein
MTEEPQEPAPPVVGSFDFEVYSSGRGHRTTCSRFRLRCDAIALQDKEILLLSVVGSETGVKALTAGLRSSSKDQKRIDYSVHLGSVHETVLTKCPDGYRVSRTKLDYGLWHILCLAKRDGFMPVVSDETIWQLLQGHRFTTPLMREWIPWLSRQMKKRGIIVQLTQSGCNAGLMLADNDILDELVSKGVRRGQLAIKGQPSKRISINGNAWPAEIKTLEEYLLAHGSLLGKQAEQSLNPLHLPDQHLLPTLNLLRSPFESQANVIEAARKALQRQKSILLVGEMGTGKTLMGLAAIHAHAGGRPYRALVLCPGQLIHKWEREIRETIPSAEAIQVESWRMLLPLYRSRKPIGVEWYIIARDRAKLGAKWQPVYQVRTKIADGFLRCPECGRRLVNDKREPLLAGSPGMDGQPGTGLWRRRFKCEWVLSSYASHPVEECGSADRLVKGCGSPLWQMNGELRRYEPALYIKRRLRNVFEYLILDEVHEAKGTDTAQGHAAAALIASCRKVIALTGTLIGGYAEHLRPLLFRLSPASLIREGLGWSNATAFNERYGRIETRITERSGGRSEDNRMSRGSKTTIKMARPGIMPPLFGRHLIDKCVFLSLNEVAQDLPPLTEDCVPIPMDRELAVAYQHDVEAPLREAIQEMMKRRDRRLLGTMVQTLLAYPDHPFGWEQIGYWKNNQFATVATPPNLAVEINRPKEQALINLVRSEKENRRQVWVYVQYTDKHDVQTRLERLLKKAGLEVGVLRSSIPLARREEWIAKHAWQLDVVISHPRLVETGLDLFDKAGRHNFPTLCFYETGYNLFTLRQASRRAWRIGQRKPCRVVYLYYERTMQDRALALMGKKLAAAQALEGKFSSEGLVSMAGEDASVEIALARSLVDRIDEGDVKRMWSRVSSLGGRKEDCRSLQDTSAVPCNGVPQGSLFEATDWATDELPVRQRWRPAKRLEQAIASSEQDHFKENRLS